MSNILSLSNNELLRAALNCAGLRRAFYPMVGEFPYQWRWLERFHRISAPATYETGTVTIANGVITGVGTTFPTASADYFMSVDGHIVFISGYTSATVIATAHTELAVAAGATFVMYRYRFPLPADFTSWTGGVTYSNGSDNWMLAGASEAELRLRYAVNYNYNNRTSHYSITGTPSGDFNITLWPVPQPDAFIQGVYIAVPEDNLPTDLRVLGDDEDPILQCAPAYAEMFIEAIMAAAEAYNDDAIGIHEQRFQSALATCVAHDKIVSDGFDFSRALSGRMTRTPFPTSIDFSGQL